jgi:hypothetical protein
MLVRNSSRPLPRDSYVPKARVPASAGSLALGGPYNTSWKRKMQTAVPVSLGQVPYPLPRPRRALQRLRPDSVDDGGITADRLRYESMVNLGPGTEALEPEASVHGELITLVLFYLRGFPLVPSRRTQIPRYSSSLVRVLHWMEIRQGSRYRTSKTTPF